MISVTGSRPGGPTHAPGASRRASQGRTWAGTTLALVGVTAAAALTLSSTGVAQADTVAYLINVTVRPGYGFPNAQAAVDYGNGLCDKIQTGQPYASLLADVKRDFGTADEYQASYLITQAANELCPAAIWQLRQSAAGYRPGSE